MFYSQKSYPKIKLGTCSCSIASSGCFITSVCNLMKYYDVADIDPVFLNEVCISNGFYSDGCNLSAANVASHYGMTYTKQTAVPSIVVIAETDHYKKLGFPQHFFLYNPNNGERVDPLDLEPQWEPNTYHIVSYRVFLPGFPIKSEKEAIPVATPKIEPESSLTLNIDNTQPQPENTPTEPLNAPESKPAEQSQPSQPVNTNIWSKITELLSALIRFLKRN